MEKMHRCVDPKIGAFLHSFELGILSQEDNDRFEEHLLKCESCFNEVKTFNEGSNLLRNDSDIRSLITRRASEVKQSKGLAKGFKELIWPRIPVIFRPAFLYIIIVLLIISTAITIPSYFASAPTIEEASTPEAFQEIYLTPFRNLSRESFNINKETDGIINIVCPEAVPNDSYQIVIINKDSDQEIIRHIDFDGFDKYGKARLLFPRWKMTAGDYAVRIEAIGGYESNDEVTKTVMSDNIHATADTEDDLQKTIIREYNFKIDE